ncbi:bifunctional pinoresinol-lariciresinol reductase [Colletotrichum spaethianum]|uniref:Bifunctional pinoresinol-lariciresinol reductase n=1 Tax=Colletotrichum spaethianum TaxID=700344 RepID=A0AA37PFM7_9PEZI|nr:bifunctional pinoresinol-lariciresinol reductase [Colletotrichum spaethianum]GKT51190.1 bifunctional pinoresinol-lariciresinol reductase [Colletotrichum spaethianum]
MSSPIRKVAIIGATGQIGSEISRALLQSGFMVTAVQRYESNKMAPEGCMSVKLDIDDVNALTSAFRGHDAVISAAPDPIVFEKQKPWIEAAIAAGVKRIFPSEYSTNVDSPLAEGLPIVADKVRTRRYLVEQTSKAGGELSWTSINNGPFFELVLNLGGLGPDFGTKTARYHNGGGNLIGTTKLSDIADTVAKILRDEKGLYKEAENKSVYIHSAAVSEKQLTKLAEKLTGLTFAVENCDVEELYQDAKTKLRKGDNSAMMSFYYQMMYGKGYGGSESFQEMSWNEKVGLRTLSEAELGKTIREVAQKNGMM